MKHVRKEERELHANESVSGGKAQLERLMSAQTEEGVRLALVRFEGRRAHVLAHTSRRAGASCYRRGVSLRQ